MATAASPGTLLRRPGMPGYGWTGLGGNAKPARDGLDLDNTLVERCLSGDTAGWEELVRVHTRRVYGLCYRFTGSDAEARI